MPEVQDSVGFQDSIDIEAPLEAVFEHLVTEQGLTAWMGQWARLEPRPGGAFEVDIAGHPVRGTFLEVLRPHRVAVSWGFAGSDTLPPGSSTVTFDLSACPGGTRVTVTHAGLPAVDVPGHAAGWRHFMPRLAVAAPGGDAGDDDWVPGD